MRSLLKVLPGGLALLLALLACSVVSPALPTLATLPPVPPTTDTVSPVPATATPLPATTTPAAPATPTAATAAPAAAPKALPNLPIAASPSIAILYMLDVNNGWALTDTGVVRTMDGGVTWYNATPAGLNGAPVTPSFLNVSTAWLAAMGSDPTTGTLYHTNDGGVHLDIRGGTLWRRIAEIH